MSWNDAQSYVRWLSSEMGHGYRLPSESEWDYAARGGRETARYWGEGAAEQCRYANGLDASTRRSHCTVAGLHIRGCVDCNDGYAATSPVGSFGANGYGLHDVLGNVWEWTEDCWNKDYQGESYRGAPADGGAWTSGDCSRRVLRGGSWESEPRYFRVAGRYGESTSDRDHVSGFRVVRTLTP